MSSHTTHTTSSSTVPAIVPALATKRIPHYALPNTSFVLPAYANAEQDAIRHSFSTGNWKAIANLPVELRANYVNEATAAHVDANITSAIPHPPHGSYKKVGKTVPFSSFEYKADSFSLADQLRAEEAANSREQRQKISTREFTYSSTHPQPPPLQSLAAAEEKSRDGQHSVEPYDDKEKQMLRHKWVAENAPILHGPFTPSGRAPPASKVNRCHLPEIMTRLEAELDQDWSDATREIYCDEQDLVIMRFDLSSLDNAEGLLAYMNMLTKTNTMVSEFGLSKVAELWNHRPGDGNVYFCYKPPYVRRHAHESYFALHPERRSYRSSRQHDQSSVTSGNDGTTSSGVPSGNNSGRVSPHGHHHNTTTSGGMDHATHAAYTDPELDEFERYKRERLKLAIVKEAPDFI